MTQSQTITEEFYDSYTKTAANIIYYYDTNERKEKLKRLRDAMENNCIQSKRLQLSQGVTQDVLNSYIFNDNETLSDVASAISEYQKLLANINVNVSHDENLLQLDRNIKALLDEVAAQAEKHEDEEVQLTGGLINVIDPITKKRIVNPVKNTLCGHTYDQESITQMLQINKKTRCPVIGCKNKEFVTLQQLCTDVATKAYLEKHIE